MPNHPLMPSPNLCMDVTLAEQLGVYEALMFAALTQFTVTQRGSKLTIQWSQLQHLVSFMSTTQRDEALISLERQGVLQLDAGTDQHTLIIHWQPSDVLVVNSETTNSGQSTSDAAPSLSSRSSNYSSSTNQLTNPSRPPATASNGPLPVDPQTARRKPLDNQWQPSANTLQLLEQKNIPAAFIWSQLDTFRINGMEAGKNRNNWNTRFIRYVTSQWVYAQNDARRFQRHDERTAFNPQPQTAARISHQWHPSDDALEILQRDNIDPQFISDAVSEFILYWHDRGDALKTWNSKFVQHVRQQWQRYTMALQHSTQPTRMEAGWQPKSDCFDILALGHIPEQFARQLIAEFVLYWQDSNQVHSSWNSRYIQYVKQQWAKRLSTDPAGGNNESGATHQSGYTTAAASIDRLSDTSWAD